MDKSSHGQIWSLSCQAISEILFLIGNVISFMNLGGQLQKCDFLLPYKPHTFHCSDPK